MPNFRKGDGDWKQYRLLPRRTEVDFHFEGRREVSYAEAMGEAYERALKALQQAQEQGFRYVIFQHGHSTSGPGKTTARSVVRGLMRSRDSTPYVIKAKSIQHYSVFVAAIKPLPATPQQP